MSEGYIKFHCDQILGIPAKPRGFEAINLLRTKLWDMGLVGERAGVGFGNLSLRIGDFVLITGSRTGGVRIAKIEDYSLVLDWDLSRFRVKSLGLKPSSSETFTHLSVYTARPGVNVVVHLHWDKVWNWGKDRFPGTPEWSSFGSEELAKEVFKLVVELNRDWGVIGLWGHQDGLVFWGRSVGEVWGIINRVEKMIGGEINEI